MLSFLRKISDNNNSGSLANSLRKKRFRRFFDMLGTLSPPVKIIDLGGTENYWEQMGFAGSEEVKIFLVNRTGKETVKQNLVFMKGDACNLSAIEEQSFDIAFSNSVIEHVGGFEKQLQMVKEMKRVAPRLYLQTPNLYFPLEPHFLFPFFQFFPLKAKVWLLMHFNLGWYSKTNDRAKAEALANSAILLSYKTLRKLFPNAKIYRERILGLTKSFVVLDGDWKSVK
jgi:hypothetical protein